MGHYASRSFHGETSTLTHAEGDTSYFLIARRTDGRWEVEYSKGKHKRIYDRLIDATAGAVEGVTKESGACRIRVQRDSSFL